MRPETGFRSRTNPLRDLRQAGSRRRGIERGREILAIGPKVSQELTKLTGFNGIQLHLEPGQTMISCGPDRNLTVNEAQSPADGQDGSNRKGATWLDCYQ
jgi:hypothetical protein